jgi:hypothetical protein
MSGRLAKRFCLITLLLPLSAGLAQAQQEPAPSGAAAAPRDPVAEAQALAQRIDKLIEARWAKAGITPAPQSGDAEFFRRLSLDLSGRIPNLLDIRDFIDDDRPDKRALWIERVLDSEGLDKKNHFAKHFAAVLRSQILSGNSNNFQVLQFEPFFETWLQQKLQTGLGYDQIVRDLLTSQPVPQGGPSPSAFFFDNENKPENLAGSASRIFLGVKLECAQCHKHPFADWTKNQFWEMAAFFNTPNNIRPGQPRVAPANFRPGEIRIPGTDKVAKAKFLDGKDPGITPGSNPRALLANWMTSTDNPYFARAAVDQIWVYFFGASLLEPILEPSDEGPPTYPELLDLLTQEFKAHKHDVKFLARAIANTRAYQRSSTALKPGKDDVVYFARMSVRGLSPEQLFDSVAEATEYQEPAGMQPQPFNPFNGVQTPRRDFITKFAGREKKAEAHTSILQALFMMNGKFLAERTRLDNNKSLQTIASSPRSTAQKLETLYLMSLSRQPRPEETERLVRYVDSGGPTHNSAQALADVYWALLNSAEFMLNH